MDGVRSLTVLSRDGLRLAVEDAGPRHGTAGAPLLCLAGLTRTKRDFHTLRDHFAFHPTHPRRVVLMDTRGRGESDYATDASTYTIQHEADDAAQVACALGLHNVVIVGTSRGGLLAMVLALSRPGLMAASVMNDIGPRVAGEGLARLSKQLGSSSLPESWEAATERVKRGLGEQFPAFSDEDWAEHARLTFAEKDGRPALAFDPKLLEPLRDLPEGLPFIDVTGPFRALATRPMLMVHGERSDLLTDAIVVDAAAMGAQVHTVAREGHAPSLRGETLMAIERFLDDTGL